MRLGCERFGRDAAKHLVLALASLGAALEAAGPVADALLAEAHRRLGFAEASLRVGGLYGDHAASLAGRSRQIRVPSGL